MKAIGYIKMVNKEKGFGFIYTIPLSETENKTIDVHFKLREWCEKYEPEVGMCVYFGRKNGGAKGKEAVQVVELSLSRNHLCLALDYAVHGYKILGFDKKIGRSIPRNVLHDLLSRSTGTDEEVMLIWDVFCGYFHSHSEVNGESVIDKLAKSNKVREILISAFDKGCEDCDERIANAIRHLKERKIEGMKQKRSYGRFIGIVKWFAPGKDGSGQGYIVTNRHGYADLRNAQGELIEPRFDEMAWLEKDIRPRQDDVVIYERGGRFGEAAIKVRLLTDSADDLLTVFQYAPESVKIEGKAFVSSRSDRPPKDYKFDLLNYASRKVLLQYDRRKAQATFSEALSSVDEQRRVFICEKLILDSSLAVKLRELFFNDENSLEDDIVSELVRAKLLASLKETMLAEQERLIEECELNYWRDEKNDRRLIGRFVRGSTEVKDVRFPTFGRLNRELSVVTNYVPSSSVEYCFFEWKFSNNDPNHPCLIETVGDPVSIRAQEIVDMIRKQVDKDPDTRKRYETAVETIRNQLVGSGAEVFIYELLQNADDYPNEHDPVDVEIVLTNEYLIFRHTGCSFGAENVAAICDINAGEKTRKRSTIGYKGIGFKTVFAGTDCVYIKTGEYSFAFDRKESEKKHIPWEVTPYWRTDDKINDEVLSCFQAGEHEYRVNIAIHPDNSAQILGYASVLNTMFSDEKSILFLRNVRSVRVRFGDGSVKYVSNDRGMWQRSRTPYCDKFSEAARGIIEAAVAVNNPKIPRKYLEFVESSVSFACRVDHTNPERLELEKDEGSTLYCYLPAKNARWGFGFIFNSDMIPNGRRDDIELKDEYDTTNLAHDLNLILARQSGRRFFDWVEELLVMNKFSYESIFALIPDFDKCMRDHSRYKDFINEFKEGFVDRLPELCVPSSGNGFKPISQVVYDSTGVLKALGGQLWVKLGEARDIVHESLLKSDAFASFVERYKEMLRIIEFRFDNLVEAVDRPSFQEWLSDPMANEKFLRFLVDKGGLERFSNSKIFLDDKRELGSPKDMYYHKDVEKYLKDFAHCFRYLPSSTPCHSKLEAGWFKEFDPKAIVCEEIFSEKAMSISRQKMGQIDSARLLLAFIDKYKTVQLKSGEQLMDPQSRKTRWFRRGENAPRFPLEVLQKIPVVLDNDTPFDALESPTYSLFFLLEDASLHSELEDSRWFRREWIGFIHKDYFIGDEGDAIRSFLKDWKLINEWNTQGLFTAVADKFKTQIRSRIIEAGDDLDFYDFIKQCIGKKVDNIEQWIKEQLTSWPVLDANGNLVERNGKFVFYYNPELLKWLDEGWIKKDAIVVLNEKYSSQKEVFKHLGVSEYNDNSFGEIFKNCLSSKLNLDTREKIVLFHKFMAEKRNLLVNLAQVNALKETPVLVCSQKDPVIGISDVFLPVRDLGFDEDKLLDSSLLWDGARDYWKSLDMKELDEKVILEERFKAYLVDQQEFISEKLSKDEFRERHLEFMKVLVIGDALESLKDSESGTKIKEIRLFSTSGELVNPEVLKRSRLYSASCDFETYFRDKEYVSEMYGSISGIEVLLTKLKVQDGFLKADVGLLNMDSKFCEYFWKTYLPSTKNSAEILGWLSSDVFCVLDQNGEVRRPIDLYATELESYVLALPNYKGKFPKTDGIDKKHLSQLTMKTSLSVEDSLDFLRADSECKMYKMRGKVLQWIADGCSPALEEQAKSYYADERATWMNGQGQRAHIGTLCLIRQSNRKNSSRALMFRNDEHVVSLKGIGAEGDGKDFTWSGVEKAFEWLGVRLIDNQSLLVLPTEEKEDRSIKSAVKLLLLIFLAERDESAWESEFAKKKALLEACSFATCKNIVVSCKENDWLKAEHGKFIDHKQDPKPRSGICYVGSWQSKHVYGDVIRYIKSELQLSQYSDDDLKEAFDTDVDKFQLAERICSNCAEMLKDERFVQTLQELAPDVYKMACDKLREKERASNQPIEKEKDEPVAVGVAQTTEKEKDEPVTTEVVPAPGEEAGQSEVPPKEHETKTDYSEQMRRVFGNDLTPEQMNDINRIDCIRLFNSLMQKGLEPKYLIGCDGQREKGYGDIELEVERDFVKDMFDKKQSKRKVDHSATIETKDGRIIHVVGAINGVAHLPPRWWTRIANQRDEASVKYIVCAIVYHRDDGFQYLGTREELKNAIGDRFTVVRVQSESREERFDKTLALFNSDPECSDYSTYSLLLLHKMKSDRSYECVFTKEFGNETINEW